jgi:hypothetical protein
MLNTKDTPDSQASSEKGVKHEHKPKLKLPAGQIILASIIFAAPLSMVGARMARPYLALS